MNAITRIQKRTNPIHLSKNNHPARFRTPREQHNDDLTTIVSRGSRIRSSPPYPGPALTTPSKLIIHYREAVLNGGERVRTDDPLLAKQVLSQLSYTPRNPHKRHQGMGQGGLEPPTPRLSSVCSNQLSY